MKKAIGIMIMGFLFFIAGSSLIAQNLIPNPSFDDSKGRRPTMKPWKKINTVDYFVNSDKQSYKEVNASKNDRNYILRKPRTGSAYVGLRVWPKYSEYLQVVLSEPLKADVAYSFEMYITPSKYSNCYLKTIGVSFYSTKPPYSTRFGREDYPPQIEMYKPLGIRDTSDWIRVNGVFIAKGGEKIMTIGNFSVNNGDKFKRKKLSFTKREAYYYIDDIALYELGADGRPIMNAVVVNDDSLREVQDSLQYEATFSTIDSNVRTIYFEEDDHKLDHKGYMNLAVVAEYLLENPDYAVEIFAYSAPGEFNGNEMKLAEKRAKSVFIFLSGNKVPKDKIIQKPIGNSCEYGRSNDPKRRYCRKVELFFINTKTD
ncbi:MAG: OmpA family protein [Bacteroidales bacterium]|nr:OmpA family protein [Bacteroidales bacterium]